MSWYVAFEGPIAAGKTTIAKLFAKAAGAQLLLEDFSENKFLADFYQERHRWALPMQLDFLLSRHGQFASYAEHTVPIVSDHTYGKDLIFAGILLRGRELQLYESIQHALKRPTREPTLIVYLDAPDEVLLKRIRQRNRPYEKAITASYLGELRDAYRRELLNRHNVRVTYEDTCELDLKSHGDLVALYDRILKNIPMETVEKDTGVAPTHFTK